MYINTKMDKRILMLIVFVALIGVMIYLKKKRDAKAKEEEEEEEEVEEVEEVEEEEEEEEEEEVKPPVVVDVPPEFRRGSTTPWRIASRRAAMKVHNRGHLSSPQAWSAEGGHGAFYQMDNGKIADIVGVAIKGRKDSLKKSWGPQFVKTFKVKYYDAGTWKDVDGGAIFNGNKDVDTLVKVKFATPVKTRFIRIYYVSSTK